MAQPPLRLVWTIGPKGVDTGVNGMKVGVGSGGAVHSKRLLTGLKTQRSGSSQSVFVWHWSPSSSGGAHVPCVPKMSQRFGSRQVSESQHTPSVQKPVSQTSGLVHGPPVGTAVGPGVNVGVGVGRMVQSPGESATLHDSPDGHDSEVQHTRSSVLQK